MNQLVSRLDTLLGRIFKRRLDWGFSREVLDFIEEGKLPSSIVGKPRPVTPERENVLSVKFPNGEQVTMVVVGAELGDTPFWEEVRIAYTIASPPTHLSIFYFTFSGLVSFERNLRNLADYAWQQKPL